MCLFSNWDQEGTIAIMPVARAIFKQIKKRNNRCLYRYKVP